MQLVKLFVKCSIVFSRGQLQAGSEQSREDRGKSTDFLHNNKAVRRRSKGERLSGRGTDRQTNKYPRKRMHTQVHTHTFTQTGKQADRQAARRKHDMENNSKSDLMLESQARKIGHFCQSLSWRAPGKLLQSGRTSVKQRGSTRKRCVGGAGMDGGPSSVDPNSWPNAACKVRTCLPCPDLPDSAHNGTKETLI